MATAIDDATFSLKCIRSLAVEHDVFALSYSTAGFALFVPLAMGRLRPCAGEEESSNNPYQ